MPLLAFAFVVALIPVALVADAPRRRRRRPAGQRWLRTVASLSLSPSQRVVVVELMQGADARWLVLGVSADRITHPDHAGRPRPTCRRRCANRMPRP